MRAFFRHDQPRHCEEQSDEASSFIYAMAISTTVAFAS